MPKPRWTRRPDPSISRSGLQVAPLQFRALPRTEPKAIPEIAFEIAVALVDGVEACFEVRRVHRADRLPNFVRQVGGGSRIATVKTVGQQIIFADDALGDAERVQDQRAGKAGAVLAGRAMDHH